jgi:ATP-binding cassette subfamily B protein
MRNLGRLIVQLSTGLVSYGRVVDVVSQEREPLTEGTVLPAGAAAGAIAFQDVSFAYGDGKPVLSNVNLTTKPGQAIALLGATGSGKTTLVNLLPRFYDYTDGSATLDGAELKAYSRDYLRSQIGIVEQEPFLFSRTIKENIAYGAPEGVTDEQIEEAARAAAIHDSIVSFPNGYNTLVGEKGITLSGGQKQRVAIARALLRNPRILILDDATSSVDMETEAAIRGALDNLMDGRTTFIIAHRVQSVMNADQILVLNKGRVVQRGNHEELLAQDGFYRQIYDLQARIETELTEELAAAA